MASDKKTAANMGPSAPGDGCRQGAWPAVAALAGVMLMSACAPNDERGDAPMTNDRHAALAPANNAPLPATPTRALAPPTGPAHEVTVVDGAPSNRPPETPPDDGPPPVAVANDGRPPPTGAQDPTVPDVATLAEADPPSAGTAAKPARSSRRNRLHAPAP